MTFEIEKEVPVKISGIKDSLYGGFWQRLGSLILDGIFVLPVGLLLTFLHGLGKDVFFLTMVPSLIFSIWYSIYLPIVYGGTPGKLVLGLRIIRIDGHDIGWTESIYRHLITFLLTLLSMAAMTSSLLDTNENIYLRLNWLERTQYLKSLSPDFFTIHTWSSNLWVYSELIVLLTNKRKRAIHDYIAGTVIIKARYLNDIRTEMGIVDVLEPAANTN